MLKPKRERYWLKTGASAWRECSEAEFITAERSAGFYSKSGDGVATGGFFSSSSDTRGRITYGRITKKDYGNDPEFFIVAAASDKAA